MTERNDASDQEEDPQLAARIQKIREDTALDAGQKTDKIMSLRYGPGWDQKGLRRRLTKLFHIITHIGRRQ